MKRWLLCGVMAALIGPSAMAGLRLPAIFSDHMVVQRQMPILVWGWTEPGQSVTVSMAGESVVGKADQAGRFELSLPEMQAGGPYELSVVADETKNITDVLVGEVWLCSGQSNMQWSVGSANDPDLETLTARYPQMRLITVPQVGTQELQDDFNGAWSTVTPESTRDFSAVGYFFGRQLHQTLDVPIGLIDNAWGGSAAEAWVPRSKLTDKPIFEPLMERWAETEATYDHDAAVQRYEKALTAWQEKAAAARKAGKPAPGGRPRAPRNPLTGQHRPANLYNGVLNPIIGYTIRGTIWYQGESNSGRAFQYRELFPLMIQTWRDDWMQGDFPFYWVQLADYRREVEAPGDSTWAELREAQTMTLDKLPHTGEAVILNLGEADDIHPKNKQDVAKRLARLALANEYGYEIVSRSPRYQEMSVDKNRVTLTFSDVGGGLDTFDVRDPMGFTIAGEDGTFVPANARITSGKTLEVWSDAVESPVAVRYAWADNPICNVQNKEGLPLTPFRTDDWPGVTVDVLR